MKIEKVLHLLILISMFISSLNAVIYEDAETNRALIWSIVNNHSRTAKIETIYDTSKNSNVIKFIAKNTADGFKIGGFETENSKWNNTNDNILSFDFKYEMPIVIYVRVETNNGHKYLHYKFEVNNGLKGNGRYIKHSLGDKPKIGTWIHIERNLAEDIAAYNSGNSLIATNAFILRGAGSIDNLKLINSETPIIVDVNNTKDKLLTSPNVEKYTYVDLYESKKNDVWHMTIPNNKFGTTLQYDTDEGGYVIETVADTLKDNGKSNRDGWESSISSPNFSLDSTKNYQLVLRVKTTADSIKGQNFMVTLRGPRGDNGKSKWESIWSTSQNNVWEEIYIPLNPPTIQNPQGNTWYLTFFSALAYGAYTNGSKVIISKDIDLFELPKGKELVSTKGIDLEQEKQIFESSTRKVDALGNFYTKENDGSWKHIFPKLIFKNSKVPNEPLERIAMYKKYKEYGFNGVMDITSYQHLLDASTAGLTNLSITLPYQKTDGIFDEQGTANTLNTIHSCIFKTSPLPSTACQNQNTEKNIIWYILDNEYETASLYDFQNWLADYIDTHSIDPITNGRRYPIFYLNGQKGLPRAYLNTNRQVMDITGSYVGADVNGIDKNGKKDLEAKILTQFLTPNQKAPASVIELQKHFHTKFMPSLFYGIIQGGRALSVWKDGFVERSVHTNEDDNLSDTYWGTVFKDTVSNQLDEMLPLIQQPHYTSWTATTNATDIRIGTRELDNIRYLILANFANTDKTVTVNLDGYQASQAIDYFTGDLISLISNSQFSFTIGSLNNGYKVIKIIP